MIGYLCLTCGWTCKGRDALHEHQLQRRDNTHQLENLGSLIRKVKDLDTITAGAIHVHCHLGTRACSGIMMALGFRLERTRRLIFWTKERAVMFKFSGDVGEAWEMRRSRLGPALYEIIQKMGLPSAFSSAQVWDALPQESKDRLTALKFVCLLIKRMKNAGVEVGSKRWRVKFKMTRAFWIPEAVKDEEAAVEIIRKAVDPERF